MVNVYYDPNGTSGRYFGVFSIKNNKIVAYKKITPSSPWYHTPVMRTQFKKTKEDTTVEDMSRFILLLTFPTEQAYDEWAAQDHPEFQI